MATDEGPLAKKQKLMENVNTAVRLYEPPTKHTVLDLYDPEIVSITVSNKAQLLDPSKMTFTIPKGLICSRSEYFQRVFGGDFIEGKAGVLELDDVTPRTFRCFIGWLYCHRIFIEELQPGMIESTSAQDPETQA